MSPGWTQKGMARPERFELPTYSSGGCRSIQLSYGRVVSVYIGAEPAAFRCTFAPRMSAQKYILERKNPTPNSRMMKPEL